MVASQAALSTVTGGAGCLDGAVANLAPNSSNSEGGGGGGYTRATVGRRDGRESDGSKSTSNAADANGSLPVARYAHLKARSATQAKAYERLDTSLMAARTASTRATPTPASDPAVQQPPDTPQKKHTGYEYNDVVLALDGTDLTTVQSQMAKRCRSNNRLQVVQALLRHRWRRACRAQSAAPARPNALRGLGS